ncbi:hypothetical protein [Streptomyces erythrochromogenes]|uniref:hypothetical protein n=1 Tax=Streptomyces erythrochromogenes TaxID=285574 RepID=UPI003F4E0E0B
MTFSLPVAARVDLRRQPVEDVLERVEGALHTRLDRQALVRKRRSLGGRTERGTWVRIERRGFERIGPQGWNGTEAAAVLQGVAMPEWYQGVAWREPGEPVMVAGFVPQAGCRSSAGITGDGQGDHQDDDGGGVEERGELLAPAPRSSTTYPGIPF